VGGGKKFLCNIFAGYRPQKECFQNKNKKYSASAEPCKITIYRRVKKFLDRLSEAQKARTKTSVFLMWQGLHYIRA
jgi:hypothetical protein